MPENTGGKMKLSKIGESMNLNNFIKDRLAKLDAILNCRDESTGEWNRGYFTGIATGMLTTLNYLATDSTVSEEIWREVRDRMLNPTMRKENGNNEQQD